MRRPFRPLPAALCALVAVAAGTVVVAPAAANPSPTPASTPSPSADPSASATPGPDLSASAQKSAADAAVAALAAQVQAEQSKVATARGAAEAAEQRYVLQMDLRDQAVATEQAAARQRRDAQLEVDDKHDQVVKLVVSAYESSDNMPGWSVAALLTAPNIETLLSQTGLKQQLTSTQADILTEYSADLDALEAAQDATRAALQQQNAATEAAKQAVLDAQAAAAQEQAAQTALDAQLATAQTAQAAAALALAAQQAALAAVTTEQAQLLTSQYQALASTAKTQPLAPNPGYWTPALGQSVVNRALQWLGTPYSWAGGGLGGPSLGRAVDADSVNDGSIVGFDCSGLTMFSWGPYLRMPHNAAAQYAMAGALHPAVTDLQPGDLVFWSPAGGAQNISHVAIYLGGGNVVQAPKSGDVIKVTPLNAVDSGYFGATRPLT